MPVMTTRLNSSEYGVIDLIVSYSSLFIPVLLMALEQGTFRFLIDIRDNEEEKKHIISTVLFTFLPFFSIVLVLYAVFASIFQFYFAVEFFVYILFLSMSVFTSYILRGFGENGKYTISSIVQTLLNVVFICIFLIVFNAGVKGVLIAYGLSSLMAGVYNIISTRIHKYIGISYIDKKKRKELLAYSLPSIPNSISWWVLTIFNRTIISIVLGVAANGIFAIADKFASILSVLLSVFGMAWFESATLNYHKESEFRDKFFSDIFNKEFVIFGSFASLLLTTTALFFPFLVNDQFNEGFLYIPLLIFGRLISVVINFYSGIYLAKKLSKKTMVMSFQTAILNLMILLSLIWFIGLWATLISTTVAYLAMSIYRFFDVKKYIRIHYKKSNFLYVIVLFSFTTFLYYCKYWLPDSVQNKTIISGQSITILGIHIINLCISSVFVIMLNKSSIKQLFKYKK
jgi:O-antigen/teichoic acid export membrane protein